MISGIRSGSADNRIHQVYCRQTQLDRGSIPHPRMYRYYCDPVCFWDLRMSLVRSTSVLINTGVANDLIVRVEGGAVRSKGLP